MNEKNAPRPLLAYARRLSSFGRRGMLAAVTLFATLAAPVCATPVAAQVPRAAVVVHNRSSLLPHTIADAQKLVDRIFIKAGVELVWLASPPRSNGSDTFGGPVIRVIILAKEAADAIGYRRNSLGFTPGSKQGSARLAYVLEHRVSAVSRGYSARPGVVLASTMVHEIGHMLISGRHSPAGLMRRTFNQADFRKVSEGALRFTDLEAAEIRARISVRDVLSRTDAGTLGR